MLKKKIYLFSGLGADERAFRKLDLSPFSAIYIQWILPKNNESIEMYATRLLAQITTTNPILIGLSFGGIMAIEVAKQISTEKILLIASVKTSSEVPFYYRIAGKLRLHKLLPQKLLLHANFITNWFFGVKSKREKNVLKQILKDTDSIFLTWAIDKIVSWKNKEIPSNIIHIHGEDDKILPRKFVDANVIIKNGGHLMTLDKSGEISKLLKLYII
ncbi:pimeloyl-ACP methyl ester carboxylesterase [Pedobacter sp. UYP30]|uniref:alpha/beta hydrolase n=1 Tax=Pedobacter sp. UYP30 TaxID=1756400 RepID=UPI00339180AE